MKFSPFKKRNRFVDLSKNYQKKAEETKKEQPKQDMPFFVFNSETNQEKSFSDEKEINFFNETNETPYEKRKRFAKRLANMTEKIEDLSNQIYHLEQRIEVLEKQKAKSIYD